MTTIIIINTILKILYILSNLIFTNKLIKYVLELEALHMRKLMHREVKEISQGYSANK